MTVKLLMDWPDSRDGKNYVAGNLLTTDAGTESGLIAAKMATATLTGGTAYVAPVEQVQIVPVMASKTLTGGSEIIGVPAVYRRTASDLEVLFQRPAEARYDITVPNPYSAINGFVLHPSIVYSPNGIGGYSYWLAYTPMTNNDSTYENPCICASNDCKTWVLPNGAPNPVIVAPTSPAFNSDPHLVIHPDGKTLIMIYRVYSEGTPAKNRLKITTTTDGSTWTAPVVIWEGLASVPSDMASPSLWYDSAASKWVCLGHDVDNVSKSIRKITSNDLLSGWDTSPVAITITLPTGRYWWHSSFMRLPSGRIIGMIQDNNGSVGQAGWLYVAESLDGTNFTWSRVSTAAPFYRPTFTPIDVNGALSVLAIYSFKSTSTMTVQRFASASNPAQAIDEVDQVGRAISSAINFKSSGVLAADNFIRADSAVSLGSTIDGVAWANISGTDILGISTNAAYNATTGNCRAFVDLGVTSYSVSAVIKTVGTEGWLGFAYVDATHFSRVGHQAGVLMVQQYNTTLVTNTIIMAATHQRTLVAGDVLRVDVCGGSAKVYLNGDFIYTFADTLPANTSKAGLFASGASVTKWDAFCASPL